MQYSFELTGTRGMFHHKDDVLLADELSAWRKDPRNKNVSKAGDDRSPAWTWITYLYHDGEHVAMPFANLSKVLSEAGARMILKGKKTYKEITQSGIVFGDEYYPFFVRGQRVKVEPILDLQIKDKPFVAHIEGAQKLGFKLDVRRAPIGMSKHVRVRPVFLNWSIQGTFEVKPDAVDALTPDVVKELWRIAGNLGLGDWRPSAKKSPGPYGTFEAKVKKS